MPKLSIIIPVYNAEGFLHQTLDTILGQSLKDIEVICVDDGSTDRSVEILRSYAEKDSRVQVLCQQNLHAGVARNAGLAVATGEYVHFMDADDYVLDYAYEALYNKAVKYDLDCLKFASVPYDTLEDQAVLLPAYTLGRLRPGDFNRLVGLEENTAIFKVNVAPWNGIYRRSFLEEKQIRFNDLFCVNDRSFFCAVITNAKRIMIARDRLVVHRVNMSGSLIGVRAQHFDCHFKSIQVVADRLKQDNIDPDIQATIMKREFTDLMVWFEKYSADPEMGETICAETKQFVETFQSPFAGLLRDLYRARLKRIASGQSAEKPPKPITFPVPACQHPKVSVVVPIYNVEDYLNEALHSLQAQDLEEIEFVCINDGSTDGSLTILKEYAAQDKRFRILDGPNGGYGKAMNRGIEAARGEYLGILEPDDFVPSNMYRELYKTASTNDLDFVKADFYRFMVRPDGSLRKNLYRLSSDKSYYGRVLKPGDDIETFQFVMNTWSGIYSLRFLNRWHIRHNETPGASYQDNGFWFQTFCRAERAMFVNKPYYLNRRDNPNSSMFSRKKLYCVTDEYRYIWNWMQQDPKLVEQFAPIFYAKKFSNFMVTYYRLTAEDQEEYLQHLCDEFRGPMEAGLLHEELFGERKWRILQDILADPQEYRTKIRVSVIIPVYNAEAYLRACLDPLLHFYDTGLEVICVDDGSTDGSLDILREYEAKDSRVRVFTQANAGAGAARNHGMQYARGEYLSFLDADDFFEPDMLRRSYEWAHTLDTDITVFRCDQYLESTGQYLGARYTINDALLPEEQPFAGADIPENIFKAFVGWAWDKLFRTEFVRKNGLKFQEQRTSNDMYFVFSALVKAERISTLNAILAHHRRDTGSLSVTREESWDCFYRALCALRQQLKDWNLYDRYEQDFINYSLHFSLWNVTTLRGPAYHKLFDKLVTEWFQDLGVTDHDVYYFYNREEYDLLQEMLPCTSEDFLFLQLDKARGEAAKLRTENSRLQTNVRNLQRQGNQQKRKISSLKAKHKQIKNSSIWKVGRISTWPFRKLKKLVKGK